MIKMLFIIALLLSLNGCSAVDIRQYENTTPKLSLFNYFQGSTKGWGMVQDRKGELTRQFVVEIEGHLNEQGELVIDENFFWNDGEKSNRTWTIGKIDSHQYNGRASDIVNLAQGKSYGSVLNWQYTLNLKVDESTWKINFDDWMFLQPDNVLINKAEMKKFGFRVGEVTIVFVKQ
jgi:hypothetical protein